MKRIFLALILSVATISVAFAEVYQVTATKLSVRTASTANAKVIGSLTKGMEIEVEYFDNGFAKIDFMGKTGYVNSRYLKFLKHSTPKTETEQPTTTETSPSKQLASSDGKTNGSKSVETPETSASNGEAESEGFLKETSKKIGKGYNKFKDKLFGKKNKNDKEKGKTDKEKTADKATSKNENKKAEKITASNTPKTDNGNRKYKKEKTTEYYQYAGITSYSEYNKFKGRDALGYKDEVEIAMKVVRYEKYSKFYIIFTLTGALSKGDKLLIRTGNNKLYEGYAIKDYKSEEKLVNEMKYFGDSSKAANWYSTSSMEKQPFAAEYEVDPQCLRDFEKYGIMKIGTHFGHGLRVIDYKDKDFEKASEKIGNVAHSMIEKVYGPSWEEIYKILEQKGATLTQEESAKRYKQKQEERARQAEASF